MDLKKIFSSFLLVVLLTICCYRFLDERIALFVKRVLMSGGQSSLFSANIPDLLPLFVFVTSALSLVLYFHDKHKGINDIRTIFSLDVGISLPITFILRFILKFVFGGIGTRVWLENPVSRELHWFHGTGNYSGFPSGHTAVFTVFLLDLWKYYPRYRLVYGGLLLLLALALIMTDYHFLSDITAGAYLGFIIYYFTYHSLMLLHKSRPESGKG